MVYMYFKVKVKTRLVKSARNQQANIFALKVPNNYKKRWALE